MVGRLESVGSATPAIIAVTLCHEAASRISRLLSGLSCAKIENERLRAELMATKANRDYWMTAAQTAQEHRDGANRQLEQVEAELSAARQQLGWPTETERKLTETTARLAEARGLLLEIAEFDNDHDLGRILSKVIEYLTRPAAT